MVSWIAIPAKVEDEDKSWVVQMSKAEQKLAKLFHYCQVNRHDPSSFIAQEGDSEVEKARKDREYKDIVEAALAF